MAFDVALDPHDVGLSARYWRITQAHFDHSEAQVTVWMHGWRDAAARHGGRAAAASLTLLLNASDAPGGDLHALTTSGLYDALKLRAAAAAAANASAEIQGLERVLGSVDHAVLADAADC